MARLTFSGGIHPYDGKDMSKSKPIKDVDPKGELVYPLSQHIGAPAKPVVAKGDHVLAGQLIAEAGGFVSAPIYASVSGIVKNIEPRRERLLSAVGLRNPEIFDIDTQFFGIKPVESMLGIDNGRNAARFLSLGNSVYGQCRFSR